MTLFNKGNQRKKVAFYANMMYNLEVKIGKFGHFEDAGRRKGFYYEHSVLPP